MFKLTSFLKYTSIDSEFFQSLQEAQASESQRCGLVESWQGNNHKILKQTRSLTPTLGRGVTSARQQGMGKTVVEDDGIRSSSAGKM